MIDSSMAYKKAITGSRVMSVHDKFTFANGKTPAISTQDFMKYSIDEATSDSASFSIGSAIIKKYSATLNNLEGKFSDYDFEGLDIMARPGVQLEDGSIEIIQKGRYRCTSAKLNESTIELEAYDSMIFFDRPYTDSRLRYPATIRQIVEDACLCCQMTYNAKTLSWGAYVVRERPDDQNLTFRDMIGFCAQVMCCYAKIDHLDSLSFGWYDFATLEKLQDGYDGGSFEDFTGGDSADGGDFKNYLSGNAKDGGDFQELNTYHHLFSLGSQSINTDDICITGVNVKASGGEEEKEESFLYGKAGYVLSVEENPLIQSGQVEAVARYAGGIMVGKRFRPLSVTCQSNPCIEAGDCACVTDRKQRTFFTVITNTTFSIGSLQNVDCTAETPTENNYTKYSTVTKLLHESSKNTDVKISSYDLAVQQLTNLMTNSFGVFKSEEVLEDGSIIYYMHNKPERASSSIIWKMTADAFAVSRDGGKTWNAGLDSSGNAVVNVLNAIGINASWINAGSLLIGGTQQNESGTVTVYDKDGGILFKVSKDGIVINTENFKVAQSGNIEITGKLVGMNKVYIRNTTQGTDRAVIQYKWSTEDSSYEFLNPDGTVIMRLSQNEHPVYFPQAVGMKSADIQGLYNKISYEFGGSDGANFSVTGNVIKSGVFVILYGSLSIATIGVGKTLSCMINLGVNQVYAPTRRSVTAMAYSGSRCFAVRLGTGGELSIRNLGTTDYTGSSGSTIGFRMDYILM